MAKGLNAPSMHCGCSEEGKRQAWGHAEPRGCVSEGHLHSKDNGSPQQSDLLRCLKKEITLRALGGIDQSESQSIYGEHGRRLL